MRKNAKHVLWPLTVVVIIGMGGYGTWYYFQRAETVGRKTVGQVWGRNVPESELSSAALAVEVLARLTGQAVTDPSVLTNMAWERLLLSEEAARIGITIDQKELAAFIASLPFFQSQKRFDPDLFRGRIASLGLTENVFQEQMRTLIAMEKLRNTIRLRALVSPREIADYHALLNDQVKGEYVEIDRANYAEPVPIKEEILFSLYQENQSRFQVPARVEIQYLLLSLEAIAEKVAPNDDEIEDYYKANQSLLAEKDGAVPTLEQAKTRIVNRLTEEKSYAELDRLSDEIDGLLQASPLLEPVAEKYSLALSTPGPIARDATLPGLEDASGLLRTAFTMETSATEEYPLEEGVVFFRLLNKTEAGTLTFDQAKEDLKKLINDDLTDRETKKAASDALDEIRGLMEKEKIGFAEAAKKIDREAVETPLLVRAKSEELGTLAAFLPAAFLVPVGEISPVFPTEKGYAFLRVAERIPAPPLPEAERKDWEEKTWQRKSAQVYNDWFRNLIVRAKLSIPRPAQAQEQSQEGPPPQPPTGNL
jgi:parvulin-like peptidyl-prolyl isomerase